MVSLEGLGISRVLRPHTLSLPSPLCTSCMLALKVLHVKQKASFLHGAAHGPVTSVITVCRALPVAFPQPSWPLNKLFGSHQSSFSLNSPTKVLSAPSPCGFGLVWFFLPQYPCASVFSFALSGLTSSPFAEASVESCFTSSFCFRVLAFC